jgi:hypothetical protein
MHLPSPEIRHGLVIAIPMLVMLLLALLRWWLWKENVAISATLQRRSK